MQPSPPTFSEETVGLSVAKYALDVDPDGPLGGVFAPDHGEPEATVARPLLEADVLDAVGLVLPLAGQGAEPGPIAHLNSTHCIY